MDPSVPQYGSRDTLVRRELFIVGAGIAFVIGCTYITWHVLFRMNAPDAVVRRFIEADIAGRSADQQALVARTWDAQLILDMIQEVHRQSGASVFQDYQIATTSVNGGDAQVNVTVTVSPPASLLFPSGPQTRQGLVIPFHLVREENEWKIDPTRTIIGLSGVLAAAGFQQIGPRLRSLIPPSLTPQTPSIPPPVSAPPTPSGLTKP